MATFLKKQKRLCILLIILAASAAALIGQIARQTATPAREFAPAAPTTPVLAPAGSSSEQTVDLNTSLRKTPTSSPLLPATPPPTPATGCQLSLTFVTTGGNLATAGSVSYALTAKNIGGSACLSASISVYYADNETFHAASPRATADGYYWQIGTLAPAQQYAIALFATRSAPPAGGNAIDEACLSADDAADACMNADADAAGGAAKSASTSLAPVGAEIGAWVWTTPSQMTAASAQQIVANAAANHFNALYLSVDDYLTMASTTNIAAREQQLQNYDIVLTAFLTAAAQDHIAVDAESGWRDWGDPENQWQAAKIMAFVAAYDASHAVKFRGVQYDIEPYLLPNYANNETILLTDYVYLINQLAAQAKSDGLPLSIVIPHFYDATTGWTPEITVGNTTDYTYNQILTALAPIPQSRVLVMAYRNSATGGNGSIALSQSEISAADAAGVTVIVAQETGPVTPGYTTFFGQSRADLMTQTNAIAAAFTHDKSFGGIAIDYLDTYLQLP